MRWFAYKGCLLTLVGSEVAMITVGCFTSVVGGRHAEAGWAGMGRMAAHEGVCDGVLDMSWLAGALVDMGWTWCPMWR